MNEEWLKDLNGYYIDAYFYVLTCNFSSLLILVFWPPDAWVTGGAKHEGAETRRSQ